MTRMDKNAGTKPGLKDKQDGQTDADTRGGAQDKEPRSLISPAKKKAKDPMDRGPGNY